jgi:hypothetical protein
VPPSISRLMGATNTTPTPYASRNVVLDEFVQRALEVLTDGFIGVFFTRLLRSANSRRAKAVIGLLPN